MAKVPEFLYKAMPLRKTYFGYEELQCKEPIVAYRDPIVAMYRSIEDHERHSDIKFKRDGSIEIRLTSLNAKNIFQEGRSLCTVLPDSFEKVEDREEAISFRSKEKVFLIPTLEVQDFKSVFSYLSRASRGTPSHLTLIDIFNQHRVTPFYGR